MSDMAHAPYIDWIQNEASQMTLYNTSSYFSSYIASQFILLYEHLPAKKAEDFGIQEKNSPSAPALSSNYSQILQ